ncbi:MAG TPA: SDR family oxidoreductase [Bryobacteraceae bacterium]|nr:SDR family oxidoreductase [Bryobacteraceae bacterium]
MDLQLNGKLCFVTAGANGIGEAIANLLTAEGARVIVADKDERALAASAGAWHAVFAADLAAAQGIDAAVAFVLEKFGRAPDILINNLGVADSLPFEQLSDEGWVRSLNVNLMGCVRTCRALLPRMAAQGSGAVVNIGSDLGKQPEPEVIDYGLFKIGILHLTKSLAKAYAPHVRVNAVSPGPVWTGLFSRPGGIADQIAAQFNLDREGAVKKFLADRYMPLGFGEPADVANAAVFLASPLAKFITGANLDMGGTLRGLI